MKIEIVQKLLTNINIYTIENNVAEFDFGTKQASVVLLEHLDSHLKKIVPEEYKVMKSQESTLLDFLISEEVYESSKRWVYEVMTIAQYDKDLRRLNNSFLTLKTHETCDTQLIIMYLKNPVESLTKEMIDCYKKVYLSKEDVYKKKRAIKERVNTAVQSAFPQLDISVQMIRSCYTELAFPEDILNLGIIIPSCSTKDEKKFDKFKKRYDCLNDMDNFIECLQNIGMVDIERRDRKDVFLFTDSLSGYNCQIGIDNRMLYEREKLIETYIELDERIRPLICVVFYFCRSQLIKRVEDRDPFLGTYSLTILVLNFLMNGLDKPVIPCLQELPKNSTCNFKDCLYNKNKQFVATTKYDNIIKEMRFLYHTCVIIKSGNEDLNTVLENKTTWTSHNSDNLGTLLIAFFRYYADVKNITGGVSIAQAGRTSYRNSSMSITIQDPFLPINNISCGCKKKYMEISIGKFDSAWKALSDGENLMYICGDRLLAY